MNNTVWNDGNANGNADGNMPHPSPGDHNTVANSLSPVDQTEENTPSHIPAYQQEMGNQGQGSAPHHNMTTDDFQHNHHLHSLDPSGLAQFGPSLPSPALDRPWLTLQSTHSPATASFDANAFFSFAFQSHGTLPQAQEAANPDPTNLRGRHNNSQAPARRGRGEARRGQPRPRGWSAEEERTMLRIYAENQGVEKPGETTKRIAQVLGKSVSAVEGKYWRLRGGDPKAYKKNCKRGGGPGGYGRGRGGRGGGGGRGNGGSSSGITT